MIEATGKDGASIKPDGKAGIGQGFTVCQRTATKQGMGYRRKPSRSGRASRLPKISLYEKGVVIHRQESQQPRGFDLVKMDVR